MPLDPEDAFHLVNNSWQVSVHEEGVAELRFMGRCGYHTHFLDVIH